MKILVFVVLCLAFVCEAKECRSIKYKDDLFMTELATNRVWYNQQTERTWKDTFSSWLWKCPSILFSAKKFGYSYTENETNKITKKVTSTKSDINIPDVGVFKIDGKTDPYYIIDTDYNNYLIEWTCSKGLFGWWTNEETKIYTQIKNGQDIPDSINDKINEALKNIGLERKQFSTENQSC